MPFPTREQYTDGALCHCDGGNIPGHTIGLGATTVSGWLSEMIGWLCDPPPLDTTAAYEAVRLFTHSS
jgi:hypothetical protein